MKNRGAEKKTGDRSQRADRRNLRLPRRIFLAFLSFAALLALPSLPASAQTKPPPGNWFPAPSVSCSFSSASIYFGALSRILYPTPQAYGSFGVMCDSNAYPSGYDMTWRTLEGGYCLTILGAQAARVLKREGGTEKIGFDFYYGPEGDPNKPQDMGLNSPIGNGAWGRSYYDWTYRDGNPGTNERPWIGRERLSLPSFQRGFIAKLKAPPARTAYPPGIYSGNFTFVGRTGVTQRAGNYTNLTGNAAACPGWPKAMGSKTITVSLEIKKYCYVSVTQNINFGKQAFLNKTLTAEGRIAAECSKGTNYKIGINTGRNGEGSGSRFMKRENGTEIIPYELYQDAAHTRLWDNRDNIYKSDAAGTAGEQILPVYALVRPQSESKSAGVYSDTVIVEITVD